MPFTNDLANSATDRVRAAVGDVWIEEELLSDATYTFLLDKYDGSERQAAREAAQMILFMLPRFVRERAGDIEVYGSEWFKNYLAALQEVINNPSATVADAMPYFGGISKEEKCKNDSNPDNIRPKVLEPLKDCCETPTCCDIPAGFWFLR